MGNGVALVKRENFGGRELAPVTETASMALAAQQKAAVEARYIMAIREPRDIDDARVRLLSECKRPNFAEVARYKKPQGSKKNEETGKWEKTYIEGFSIRFAEAAMRCFRNILVERTTIYDDPQKRIIRVAVTDVESNLTQTSEVTVGKTVERKSLKKGQQPLGERLNSYGEQVYIVEATEDEVATKAAAICSKAERTLGLKFIPGDILDECEQKIEETRRNKGAEDPEAARKKVIDAFAAQNVKPSDLKTYLGHDVASCSPAEVDELRKLHAAIRTGEVTWSEVLREALEERAAAGEEEPKGEAPKSPKEAVKDKLRRGKGDSDYLEPAYGQALTLIRQGEEEGFLSDGAAAGETDDAQKHRVASDLKALQAQIQRLEGLRAAAAGRREAL